jgi:hypothetical protein
MPLSRLKGAISDFHRARRKAKLELVAARLSGRSFELLSYKEVAEKLRVVERAASAVRPIPLNAIVGSVGRYADFTRTFLPRLDSDAGRWSAVMAAAADVSQLPPIEVYQIGEAYFVLDGNHRVSIARRQGLTHIDACVTEMRTKVPLAPDVQPDELIITAEYAAFLEAWRLDELRPGANLTVSSPGQYGKLESHIEVHRYLAEVSEDRELTQEEAICRWHDETYRPLVNAIREQGILRYFPGRTETDMFIWLATYQAELRNKLGWKVRPDTAGRLASQFDPQPKRLLLRMRRQFLDLVVPSRWKSGPRAESWSQQQILDRYSQRLFADIMVPMSGSRGAECSWQALEQALVVAEREGAQICGICAAQFAPSPTPHRAQDPGCPEELPGLELRRAFEERCRVAGVEGHLTFEAGDPTDGICRRAALTDLLVVDWGVVGHGEDSERICSALPNLVRQVGQPVLVAPPRSFDQGRSTVPSPLNRILLAYDGRARSREALFVAAYMAERWGASVVVLAVPESSPPGQDSISHARKYLAMHEVEATYLCDEGPFAETLLRTAQCYQSDLILMDLNRQGVRVGRLKASRDLEVLGQVLCQWDGPILLCP